MSATIRADQMETFVIEEGDKIAVIQNDPKPKRKYTRRKKAKPARIAAPKPTGEFAGLTVSDCCKACSPSGCVISGRNYCAHPRKGGLQAVDLGNSEAVARLNRAVKMISLKTVEDRFAQR